MTKKELFKAQEANQKRYEKMAQSLEPIVLEMYTGQELRLENKFYTAVDDEKRGTGLFEHIEDGSAEKENPFWGILYDTKNDRSSGQLFGNHTLIKYMDETYMVVEHNLTTEELEHTLINVKELVQASSDYPQVKIIDLEQRLNHVLNA